VIVRKRVKNYGDFVTAWPLSLDTADLARWNGQRLASRNNRWKRLTAVIKETKAS
jgi:hypothetical protein